MKKHGKLTPETTPADFLRDLEGQNYPDNSTTVVEIPTPKRWRCTRKGCKIKYMHGHSNFSSLKNKK